jgi:pimeloyl-ACP methyl ester carboxylesterase
MTITPMIFVHDMFGSPSHWYPWLSYFRFNRDGDAVDLYKERPEQASIKHYVNRVGRAMESYSEVLLIGHGMGCAISLLAANTWPEQVKGIIAFNPITAPGLFNIRTEIIRKLGRYASKFVTGTPFIPDRDQAYAVMLSHLPSDEQERLYRTMRPENPRVIREMLIGLRIKKPQCKVLCFMGKSNEFVPFSVSRRAANYLGAEVDSYPGDGHYLHLSSSQHKLMERAESWMVRNKL